MRRLRVANWVDRNRISWYGWGWNLANQLISTDSGARLRGLPELTKNACVMINETEARMQVKLFICNWRQCRSSGELVTQGLDGQQSGGWSDVMMMTVNGEVIQITNDSQLKQGAGTRARNWTPTGTGPTHTEDIKQRSDKERRL